MHIQFVPDPDAKDVTVVIHGRPDDPAVARLQELLTPRPATITCYKRGVEFYLPLTEVLFIETEARQLQVHTATEIYTSKRTLHETLADLPHNFLQIAKSTVVNLDQIAAVNRSLSNCEVAFHRSHKQVFASRRNYKQLLERLDEMRNA
ncbi:LytTR family DNA-binding domain-containing protein [Lacticaseibacillus kribbianus]|uniref:LytTR family DNA-binding domain-containing protein n=1 Tax=Lacticaseibacillus kribbianus TaxID=2926292 RepID=UPI001CD5A647|nr:LytTR family DNA-binding domain-containing protein [Lacticaseibacillus kribbianus]